MSGVDLSRLIPPRSAIVRFIVFKFDSGAIAPAPEATNAFVPE